MEPGPPISCLDALGREFLILANIRSEATERERESFVRRDIMRQAKYSITRIGGSEIHP